MPLYAFRCKECNFDFDELISYDKIQDVRCSKCGSKAKKIPSAAWFYVKGGNSPPPKSVIKDKKLKEK